MERFVFRFDGATDNDKYFEACKQDNAVLYSGTSLQLNHGWIPDFVEILYDGHELHHLTIIELESVPARARASSRKYLPESSSEIVKAFLLYLDRAIRRCQITADERRMRLSSLRDRMVSESPSIRVWTAGSLRNAPFVVERLPLIDQGTLMIPTDLQSSSTRSSLAGEQTLSPREHKTLFRSVLLLDAVVRGWDKSDATLRAWRNLRSQPLKRHVEENAATCPALSTLLTGAKLGAKLDMNSIAHELADLWNCFEPGRHTSERVLAAIERFVSVDQKLNANASVRLAFAQARDALSDA